MSILFGTMVPGAEVDFSLDLAPKIPDGATLQSAVINVRSGAGTATLTYIAVDGTKVLFRALALVPGSVVFDVVGSFSNGRDDGEKCRLSVN